MWSKKGNIIWIISFFQQARKHCRRVLHRTFKNFPRGTKQPLRVVHFLLECVYVYIRVQLTRTYFKTLNWMGIFEFQLNAPGAIKSDCEHLRNSTFFQTVHQTCASKTHTGLSSPFINSTDDWVLHLFERGTKGMLDPTYVTACLCSSSTLASFCGDLSHRRWPARARLEMHCLPGTPVETVRVCEAQQRLE